MTFFICSEVVPPIPISELMMNFEGIRSISDLWIDLIQTLVEESFAKPRWNFNWLAIIQYVIGWSWLRSCVEIVFGQWLVIILVIEKKGLKFLVLFQQYLCAFRLSNQCNNWSSFSSCCFCWFYKFRIWTCLIVSYKRLGRWWMTQYWFSLLRG